jgi:hypothetical protein
MEEWEMPDGFGRIPEKEVMKLTVNKNNEVRAKYRRYQLTPKQMEKIFSPIGVKIIAEINQYGYDFHYIKEFIADESVDSNGKFAYRADLDALGATLIKGKVVVFSKNAVARYKRRYRYYSAIKSDPDRYKAWKKKHPNSSILSSTLLQWPEMLIHELAHVTVVERKLSDYRKYSVLSEEYDRQFVKIPPDVPFLNYLRSKMDNLMHGRDFRRVYRSLCRKYGVQEAPIWVVDK